MTAIWGGGENSRKKMQEQLSALNGFHFLPIRAQD